MNYDIIGDIYGHADELEKLLQNFVLDIKWINLNGYNPSPEDLRQMYAYTHYYNAKQVALVYPEESDYIKSGTCELGKNDCSVISLSIPKTFSIKDWQEEILKSITSWYSVKSI